MAEGIRALLEGQEVFVAVDGTRIRMTRDSDAPDHQGSNGGRECRDIPLAEIRSLHVKSSDGFFLKLKLAEDAVVLGFDTHHSRDITKSIILSFMKTEQDVTKRILESDPGTRAVFNSLKQHVSPSRFWSINKDRVKQMLPIVRQQPSREVDVDEDAFVSSLDPVLLKIFGQMNCSVNQFYNLLKQSYFHDIKNPRNSLDRMISSAIRGHEAKQDFASRINSHSMLALRPVEDAEIRPSTKEGKKVEFFPIYPFSEEAPDRPKREFRFERRPLKCDVSLETVPMVEKKAFEKKDLVWIRDLSRIVYKAMKEGDREFLGEAAEITRKFVETVEKKYGGGSAAYLRRILPTYFIEGMGS